MVRIVSGRFRGRLLHMPNRANKTLRPVSVKCRAAIFNILAHTFHIDWGVTHVLDLFAGTGAQGFEALSQGSPSVTFIEGDKPTAEAIAKTCKTLEVQDSTRIITWTITQARGSLKPSMPKPLALHHSSPFSLIFCDPPYALPHLALEALAMLNASHLIAPKAILVFGISSDLDDSLCPPGFRFCFSRVYGSRRVLFAQARTL